MWTINYRGMVPDTQIGDWKLLLDASYNLHAYAHRAHWSLMHRSLTDDRAPTDAHTHTRHRFGPGAGTVTLIPGSI